jgi:hypothetical protein
MQLEWKRRLTKTLIKLRVSLTFEKIEGSDFPGSSTPPDALGVGISLTALLRHLNAVESSGKITSPKSLSSTRMPPMSLSFELWRSIENRHDAADDLEWTW